MFGGFSRHFSACKYFKERIWLFAVGINIDVGAAQYFNFSIFQSFNILISISLPHNRRVPSSWGKRARGKPFIVIWPSVEYIAGYVEMVWSMVSPG